MAYRVSKVSRKKGPQFKISYEWFEGSRRRSRAVSKGEWATLGFSLTMSLPDALKQKDSLNAGEHLKRHELRRNMIQERLKEESLVQLAYLPQVLIAEFETRLFSRKHHTKKLPIYWNTAKSILTELKLEPHLWADERGKFYDLFSDRQYSMSYVRTLVPLLNQWGTFYSKKTQKFFERLPTPTGVERERISDANYDATGGGNKESDPLTPSMLESHTFENPEHYRWLYLSVWLGLRPIEVDGMKDPKNWRVDGTVLYVYQSKLTSVPREKRWKALPCFLKEQLRALELIKSRAPLKRPLSKSMTAWFNERVTLYGGRKGFVDLMQANGQALEDISVWMGHTSIERTWKSYKNKQKARFTPPKAA